MEYFISLRPEEVDLEEDEDDESDEVKQTKILFYTALS